MKHVQQEEHHELRIEASLLCTLTVSAHVDQMSSLLVLVGGHDLANIQRPFPRRLSSHTDANACTVLRGVPRRRMPTVVSANPSICALPGRHLVSSASTSTARSPLPLVLRVGAELLDCGGGLPLPPPLPFPQKLHQRVDRALLTSTTARLVRVVTAMVRHGGQRRSSTGHQPHLAVVDRQGRG